MKPIVSVVILVLGLAVAASSTFLFQYLNCICEYRRGLGLQNWSPVPLLYPFEWLLVPVIYVCVVLLSTRIAGARGKPLIVLVGAGVAFIVGMGLFFSTGKRPLTCYLEGFLKSVTSAVKLEDVALWRQQLLTLTGEKNSVRQLRKGEFPNFVSNITSRYSPRITVTFDGAGRADFAVLMWGGGFQAHGLILNLNGRYSLQKTPFHFRQWDVNTYFFAGG